MVLGLLDRGYLMAVMWLWQKQMASANCRLAIVGTFGFCVRKACFPWVEGDL